MKVLAAALVLSPLLGLAGGVRGRIGGPDIGQIPNVTARLISIGPESEVRTSAIGQDGAFYFPDVKAGSFLLEGKIGGWRVFFAFVRVTTDEDINAGEFLKDLVACNPPDCIADDFGIRPAHPPPRILDVCAALKNQARMLGEKFMIVGSLRDTATGPILVGHCRKPFSSGGYLWMNAIGLPGFATAGALNSSQISDWNKLREPDKQLAGMAAALRKHTRGSEVHVVAVYGNLQSVFVLESAKCKDRPCAPEIHYPPMDLIDIQGLRELK